MEIMHQVVEKVGEDEIVSWENEGDFVKFPCYYCLEKFDDYDERNEHQKTQHKRGDHSAQMDRNEL